MFSIASIFGISNTKSTTKNQGLTQYITSVYDCMTVGLAVTFIVAIISKYSTLSLAIMTSPLGIVVSLAPIGISLYMSGTFHRSSSEKVMKLFLIYSAVMGLSLSTIFSIFRSVDIIKALLSTTIMFGTMSIYGHTTQKDLSKFGSIATMMILGILISSLINLFLRSPAFDFLLSFMSVILFTGLVAYDTQKIKTMYYQFNGQGDMSKKIAIFAAMQLYIDFIAIFVHLLRFFGARRND